jgi:hypothetical protein
MKGLQVTNAIADWINLQVTKECSVANMAPVLSIKWRIDNNAKNIIKCDTEKGVCVWVGGWVRVCVCVFKFMTILS